MADPAFVHLRVRSAFSMLEGAIRYGDLAKRCRANAMPAVGVVDRANLFGAMQFARAAAKDGVQPIVGASFALVLDDDQGPRHGGDALARPPEIALLAQDEEGWLALLRLMSEAYFATDAHAAGSLRLRDLERVNQGLLCLSGHEDGPIGRAFAKGAALEAKALADRLARAFDGRFYVEIMRHGLDRQRLIEPDMIALADRMGLPLLATNDVHFMDEEDFEAQDALSCIEQGVQIASEERRRLTVEHRFKDQATMAALFQDLPEALENTVELARRCAYAPPERAPILPAFDGGRGLDEAEELRAQARAGLALRMKAKFGPEPDAQQTKTYEDRLEFELDVIVQMKFPGYFLIVADFIGWAKERSIPVGPGRGSGAGSVVAWSLAITDLDPLQFGLLFERFLNPERVSMPDFDIDFCQDRRDEVIRYVVDKYGVDKVAAIITFGKLQARAVLRDVGRVMGLPYGQVDKISKMVPFNPANPPTLDDALAQEPRLGEAMREDEAVDAMVQVSRRLEGLPRHASTHAAGVVIGDRPLEELTPLYKDPRSSMPVTQFDMKDVEKAGLVKFDFLGLSTLTLLRNAEKLVRARGGVLDLDSLPLDDKAAYALMCKADTVGVFQLEGGGMRDALKKLEPDSFEDIIAMVSLYRPGPMDNIPKYIAVKKGEEKAEYLHPILKPILEETNGVIIYQEQVMQIARDLAGYSLGGADLLRRAMGKKIQSEMDAQRGIFIEGAEKKGVAPDLAEQIFDLVNKFASYGFNKSHAAAYALLAYQTAYMKANHTLEFYATLLTMEMANHDKVAALAQELADKGTALLPPDVNASMVDFAVEDGGERPAIRYALSAIKGVGAAAMARLVEEREAGGPFESLHDLCRRLGPKVIGKRILEGLSQAGALDRFGMGRSAIEANAELALRDAALVIEQQESGQGLMFDGGSASAAPPPRYKKVAEAAMFERLSRELAVLGVYMSAHPLDAYEKAMRRAGIRSFADLKREGGGGVGLKLAGVPIAKQERSSERGAFAFAQLSDRSAQYEVVIFSDLLAQKRELFETREPIVIDVDLRRDGEDLRLNALGAEPLADFLDAAAGRIEVVLDRAGRLADLAALLRGHERGARLRARAPSGPGECALIDLGPARLPASLRADVEAMEGVIALEDLA